MGFLSFPSPQFSNAIQHCVLKVKQDSWLIYHPLFPPTWLTQASQREIFAQHGQEKLEKCPRVEWSRLWIYSETFVRTGTAPQNQGNSLDTKQRPQSALNIFRSVNSSPLLLGGVILETSVLSAISAVTSTWFSRVLPSTWDRKINQSSVRPGSGGHTAISTLHLPEQAGERRAGPGSFIPLPLGSQPGTCPSSGPTLPELHWTAVQTSSFHFI